MSDHQQQNMNVIKGLLATAFGVIFMIFAYTIIIRTVLFICGALLFYYGLQLLKIPGLNNAIETGKKYIQNFLR